MAPEIKIKLSLTHEVGNQTIDAHGVYAQATIVAIVVAVVIVVTTIIIVVVVVNIITVIAFINTPGHSNDFV